MPYKDGRSKAARRKAARKFTHLSEEVWLAIERSANPKNWHHVIQPGWNARMSSYWVGKLPPNSRVIRKNHRERKLAGRVWAVAKSRAARNLGRGARGWHGSWVKGCASANSAWVRLLTVLEPGHWYGTAVIDQAAGRKDALRQGGASAYKHFERALNPNFTKHPGYQERLKLHLEGKHFEPRYLYRLNQKGERLRAVALIQTAGFIDLAKAYATPIGKTEGWPVLEHANFGKMVAETNHPGT